MTIKEFILEHGGQRHICMEEIYKVSMQTIIDLVKLKCAEQRQICYQNVPPRLCMKTTTDGTQVGVLILNAPEPEI